MMKKRLKQKLKDMSIVKKFRCAVIIMIVIPMIMIFSVIFFYSYTELENKMIENSRISMKQAQRSIQSIVEETEYLSLSMLIDDNIQNLCKQYALENTMLDSAKRSLYVSMQDAVKSKSYIDSISISYNNKVLFQYGNKVARESGTFEELASSMGGKAFWTQAYELAFQENTSAPHYVISYIRAFMDVSRFNHVIGMQRISVKEEEIAQAYMALVSDNGAEAFIVDEEGVILSSPNQDMICKKMQDMYPEMEKVLYGEEGFFKSKGNRSGMLVIYQAIEGTEWKLVQTIPGRAILASSKSLFLFMLLAILLLIIFSIIFSRIENHTIIQPVYNLSRELAKVRDGNFDVHISAASRDEIGYLAEACEEMLKRIKELIDKVYVSQIKEKESAYKALEAQINPHFLYNVLDSIHWAAIKQKDWEVSDRIEALSEFFRHVLNQGESITTVRSEIKYLQNYLYLLKNKFAGRIQICVDVDEKFLDCKMVKLVVQSLVENAIQHGMEDKEGMGNISVWAEQKEKNLYLHVEDDGAGADEDEIRRMIYEQGDIGEGAFALKNIHDRIQMQFGKEYGLVFESMINVGTVVTVKIPYETEEGVRQ
jgi:two-component system sensor histidine kinase YesM